MAIEGEYEASPAGWVADQVELYESSGGTEGVELNGAICIILTTKGAKTGKIRKTPLIRVEHEGTYAAVASKGGAPTNPLWYYNLTANAEVRLQDGPAVFDLVAHEAEGDERAEWWQRATEVWPDYDNYQAKTDRLIPLFVLAPKPPA